MTSARRGGSEKPPSLHIDVDPHGSVSLGTRRWRAALGRGGISTHKCEGDGATPAGAWRLGRVFWRADRMAEPQTDLRTVALNKHLGWCDDPAHADYNQLIELPHPAHHERLWRADRVYDVVVEVLYNAGPVRPGLGSAIFVHVAKPDYSPTEGCIALNLDDLLDLLRMANKDTVLRVPG